MSIPGPSKQKYCHEVNFKKGHCRGKKIIFISILGIFFFMMMYLVCNMSSLRSQVHHLHQSLNSIRYQINSLRNIRENQYRECPMPKQNNRPDNQVLQKLAQFQTYFKLKTSKMESKIDSLTKQFNLKDQIIQKIYKQLQQVQLYIKGMLEPLKKIGDWF